MCYMLSQTCEYALRAATHIARHGDEGPVLAKNIASEMNVPLRYLHKVLRDLVRSGVLGSSRGIGGGFRLRKPPSEVRVADVLAPFEELSGRTGCPFGNPLCGVASPCPAHERWSRVVTAYTDFLETTTLRDLVGEH